LDKTLPKSMPHMVMLDFQPTIWALPTISTSVTQGNEAREVEEEMEINLLGVVNEVGIEVEETLGNQPLLKR
jgi:hypothetical protein